MDDYKPTNYDELALISEKLYNLFLEICDARATMVSPQDTEIADILSEAAEDIARASFDLDIEMGNYPFE